MKSKQATTVSSLPVHVRLTPVPWESNNGDETKTQPNHDHDDADTKKENNCLGAICLNQIYMFDGQERSPMIMFSLGLMV